MKKLIYAAVTILLSNVVSAQEPVVILTDEDGNIVNETVVTVASATWHDTDTLSLLATLTGETERTINLRRYEVDVLSSTRNFYCWGVCYTSQAAGNLPVWESAHPVSMSPGVEVNNFHGYYKPMGQAGSSLFRFVWFDTENTNDSTWVDILFDAQVGISERSNGLVSLDAFPNPATEGPLNVRYALEPGVVGAQLILYNTLGSKIQNRSLRGTSGTVVVQRAELEPGVYFINLEVGGRALATRRLVVGSR